MAQKLKSVKAKCCEVKKGSRHRANKPWAVLKVTRVQYFAARPWKRAGLTREGFEEVIAMLPEGMIDEIHLEADAAKLVEALFGEAGGDEENANL